MNKMYRENIVDDKLVKTNQDTLDAKQAKLNVSLYKKNIKSLKNQEVSLEDFNLIQEKLIESLSKINEKSLNGNNEAFIDLFENYKHLNSIGYGILLFIFLFLNLISFGIINLNYLFLSNKDKIFVKSFKKLGYKTNLILITSNSVIVEW